MCSSQVLSQCHSTTVPSPSLQCRQYCTWHFSHQKSLSALHLLCLVPASMSISPTTSVNYFFVPLQNMLHHFCINHACSVPSRRVALQGPALTRCHACRPAMSQVRPGIREPELKAQAGKDVSTMSFFNAGSCLQGDAHQPAASQSKGLSCAWICTCFKIVAPSHMPCCRCTPCRQFPCYMRCSKASVMYFGIYPTIFALAMTHSHTHLNLEHTSMHSRQSPKSEAIA
jgi:hypothetical protein